MRFDLIISILSARSRLLRRAAPPAAGQAHEGPRITSLEGLRAFLEGAKQ